MEAATAAEPGDASAWRQLGAIRFSRHDFGAASEALETALRLDPSDLEARRHLYLTHMARGRRAAAEAELERMIALAPGDPGPRTDLAVLRLDQGAYAAAAALLEAAAARPGAGERTRFYRALALELSGRADEGRAELLAVADAGGRYAERALRRLPELAEEAPGA